MALRFEPTIFHHLDFSDLPLNVSTTHPLLALALLHKGKQVSCSIEADYLDLLKDNFHSIGPMVDTVIIVSKLQVFLKHKIKPTTILPKDIYLEQAFPNHRFAPMLSYPQLLDNGFQLYKKGIFVGLQSVSAYVLALDNEDQDSLIIDSCWLYYNTLLNKSHLIEHGVIRNKIDYRGATVEDLQLPHAVLANKEMPVEEALNCMMDFDFTFMPVAQDKKLIGWVDRDTLMAKSNKTVGECMTGRPKQKFITITPETPLQELSDFLDKYPVAFITGPNGKFVLGVATKSDLGKFAESRPFRK